VAEANSITNLRFKDNTCAFIFCASTGKTAVVTLTVVNGRVAADIEWDGDSTADDNREANIFIGSFISRIIGKPVNVSSLVEEDDDKRKQFLARFLKADEQ
jgi:hypothetical protein